MAKPERLEVIEVSLKIERFPHVYQPQTDSFLLLDALWPKPADVVLELCTGCGVIALHLAQTAAFVHAIDINPHAVKNAQHNAKRNGICNVSIHQGDLYAPVQNQRFDLILANPPYVPTPPDWQARDIIETAWNAGEDGRLIIDRIIARLPDFLKPNGRFVFVQSSLADIAQTKKQLIAQGLLTRILARKWLPLGPISRGRYNWLNEQGTLLQPEAELLVVIEAVKMERRG